MDSTRQPRIGIVGGGLAGLAAAVALSDRGLDVELFEARQRFGGRATSFRDPETGELVDNCQHVAMGCCTNFADFCRRTGTREFFRRCRTLHFFGPDGRQFDVRGCWGLPAPLHLATSFWRLGYLSLGERIGIARGLLRLARTPCDDLPDEPTIGEWLRRQGQSGRAIERFWSIVLVSALAESIDRASLSAARKVFVDGFVSARQAYELDVPAASLGQWYPKIAAWLEARRVRLHPAAAVERLAGDARRVRGLHLRGGQTLDFDFVIVGLPWRRIAELFPAEMAAAVDALALAARIESSPITSLHLWFDRPISSLPHAVLVDRLSQWVFQHGRRQLDEHADKAGYYYQVVISGARQLRGRHKRAILDEALDDLRTVFPPARDAALVHWRMITEHDAVFSVGPGLDARRPPQRTAIPNLMLAGDWTRTGWPATMEGAVRSGYLAAAAVLERLGQDAEVPVPPLQRGWLARLLVRDA